MSQWVYVRGGFELEASPWEVKGSPKNKNSGFLPYPKEQFKVLPPTLSYAKPSKDKSGNLVMNKQLEFRVYIYSLPRVKKLIHKAFDILPQGECGWSYSMNQTSCQSYSASSNFTFPICQKYFKEAIDRMYDFDNPWVKMRYDTLKKYHGLQNGFIEEVTGITIGIAESIRWCSGEEMLEAMEKFFIFLEENGIHISDGYLEWEDAWEVNYKYAWRCSKLSNDYKYQFLKLDNKTNKILYSKNYKYTSDFEHYEVEEVSYNI